MQKENRIPKRARGSWTRCAIVFNKSYKCLPTHKTIDIRLARSGKDNDSRCRLRYFSKRKFGIAFLLDNSEIFIFSTAFIKNVTKYREVLKFPSDEDLNGAAVALMRLQDTYNLETSSLARGELNGVQYR